MAVRMAVYYRKPDDPETFEKRYVAEHLPLVRKYANIQSTAFFKVGRSIAGDHPYSFVFVAQWADKDAWKADITSPAAAEATEHAQSLGVPFDVVMLDEVDMQGV